MTLVKPEPFNVRGKNYAVEMTTDVGFLATGLTPLREAFGLEIGTGNPFALPCAPSLNVVAARDRGGGNGRADKGKAGGKVSKGKAKDVTADRAATGGKEAAPGCTRVGGKADRTTKQNVPPPVRGATDDINPGEGGSDTPADMTPTAVSANAAADEQEQTDVEGSGDTLKRDDVAQSEVEVAPRRAGEEERLKLKDSAPEGRGVEGGGDGGSASVHEVLCRLGDVDDEQRARLARAQRFLEEEVARSVPIRAPRAG